MTTYYSKNPKFYVSVDCIIFGFNEGELNLLLLKRNFQPAMGEWSLMGVRKPAFSPADNTFGRISRSFQSYPFGAISLSNLSTISEE